MVNDYTVGMIRFVCSTVQKYVQFSPKIWLVNDVVVVLVSKSNLNLCSSVPPTTSSNFNSSDIFSHLKNLTVLFCAGANEKSS